VSFRGRRKLPVASKSRFLVAALVGMTKVEVAEAMSLFGGKRI
jgi:hypothetical protein